LLVTAPVGDRLAQFLVPADAPGLTITPMEGIDLVKRFASVRFDGVEVPASDVLGAIGEAAADVERQLQVAVALQSAETVGALDAVFELTVRYLADRYSFGRPVSSYQAIKHRLADLKLWLEACHATATAAARSVQREEADAPETVSAAASYIGGHASEMVQDCVQLHGGIGITWEHDLHLYLRRVALHRSVHGTPAEHRDRIAELLGL
jgi:alkylation response protein AidB-like acyl-CoA dehydrogenase